MAVQTVQQHRTVADPNAAYLSMRDTWRKNRAVCSGEQAVKEYDSVLDTTGFTNLLIPFSEKMDARQYLFYKAEAELPGITAEYLKLLVSSLLRKEPVLKLPENIDPEAMNWIRNDFGEDGLPLSSVIEEALTEELLTQRCWIYVDHPYVDADSDINPSTYKPYPVIWKAENVINWTVSKGPNGMRTLTRVVVRQYEERYGDNEFHPELVDTVYVHEIVDGFYRVRKFQEVEGTDSTTTSEGHVNIDYTKSSVFEEVEILDSFLIAGKRLDFIPAWPLNGSIPIVKPLISSLVDKEVALYNKISRRNHLLYGASTYTPYIKTDMIDDEFKKIMDSGLGTWIKLGRDDSIDVLRTPTEALADLDRAIAAGVDEMAKLGVRMLSPETAQSGVALQLRNMGQTAKLGTLNMKVSAIMRAVIAFMLSWRYQTEVKPSEITFSLSEDLTPGVLGEAWMRLVTEWYESKLIPRSVWLSAVKQNDILPSTYDDEVGRQEIMADELLIHNSSNLQQPY